MERDRRLQQNEARQDRGDDQVIRALRSLPRLRPPAGLNSSLRVLASRELQQRVQGLTRMDRVRLFIDNLMRPLALPFAGGVFSAVILFSMWVVPSYPVRAASTSDIPISVTTAAAVRRMAPIATTAGEDVVVDVAIDGDGRMIDYSIVSGDVSNDGALRRSIEGFLLLTSFTPATGSFGQPVAAKLRLTLRSSHIDVIG
ncbi:MAG TPA: hypothetical protein VNX18_06695 [Bryobacteraceae bacterium]|nr:hypothetical protein [Bryobacteraceae bacterium]